MAFGKAIETQFRSIGGELYRIEVYLWDYVSAQHEIDADVPGFELSYPSGPRHHFPVRGSSCDVHLVVDDNTQLNLINQIILAPEGDVRVNIDKWNGASFEALWRGKGIPSESSYTYEHFPTGVTIFATDGLSDLREKTFPDDTPQELSMIEIISICLEQTGLQLDIVTADDWYPLGATMNDETDPLDIVSINPYRTYAKEREDEVAEIEGWRRRGTHRMPGGATGERQRAGRRPDADQYADCYKILTDILINKFLELRQSGGVWRIIQRPENLKSSYNIRTYNYAGVRQSHGSLNPRISLEGKDWERVPDVLNTLALKSAAVSYYHGKIIEVFSNLDWSRWTVDGIQQYPEGWTWTSRQYPGAGNIPGAITRNPTSSSRGGDVRGRQSDYAWMMASVTSTPVVPGDLSSLKRNYVIPSIDRRFRFRLSHQGIFSEHGYNIDAASRSWFYVRVKIGSQYLDRLGDLNVSAVWLPVNLGESMQTLEVETDNITIDSEIEIEISAPILTGGGSGLIAALVGDVTVDLIEEDTDEGDVVDESVSHDTIAKITDSKNSEHFEPSEPVYHGDGPTSFHLGHMVFDGSPTELWRRSSVADDIPIHRLLTMFFLRFGLATRSIFKGKLIGEFLPHNIIQVDGKWRLFDSGSFNPNTDTWEGEWYELKDDAAAILYQDYIVDNPSGRGSFGSSEQTLVSFGGAFENLITNRAIALTTSVLEDGTQYTEIPISAIGETLLNSGDTIVLINRATAKPEYLTVTDTQQPSDTVIKVEQFTPDEDIVVNSSVQLTDSFIKSSIIATNEAIDLRVTHEELDTYFNLTAHWARLQAGVFSSPDWNGQINNKNPGEWEPGDGDGEITNEGTQGWAISLKGDSSFHNAFIRGSVISDSIIIDPVFSSVEITDGKFRTDAVHFQFRNLADNAFKPVRVGTSVADANDALNRAAGDGRYGRLAAVNTWTENNYFNANVGINETSPAERLHVEGFARTSLGYKVGTTTVIDVNRDGFLNSLTVGATLAISSDRDALLKSAEGNSFVSGWTGSGWRITDGATMELDNLRARGRVDIYELMINQIRATNGNLFVTSAARVATVTSEGGNRYTLTFEDNIIPFAVDDLLRAQRFTGAGVYQSNVEVESITGNDVLVELDSGNAPAIGMEYVRLGNLTQADRQGTIYLTSEDANAPFTDVLSGVSSFADWNTAAKIKMRSGLLDGLTGGTNEWGIIAGKDGYGENDSWIKVSNVEVIFNEIDELKITTGNLDLRAEAGGWHMQLRNTNDRQGLYVFNMDGTVHENILSVGRIYQLDDTLAPDPIEIEATARRGIMYEEWDGLEIKKYFELSNTIKQIAGWEFSHNELSDTNIALMSGANARLQVTGTGSNIAGITRGTASTSVAMWAGSTYANRDSAPFRVSFNGNIFHSSIVSLLLSQAGTATNTVDAVVDSGIEWKHTGPTLGTKAGVYYIHRAGINRIYLKYERRLTDPDDSGRIRLSLRPRGGGTPISTHDDDFTTSTTFTDRVLSVDVSGLTNNTIYFLDIAIGAWFGPNPPLGEIHMRSPIMYGTAIIET